MSATEPGNTVQQPLLSEEDQMRAGAWSLLGSLLSRVPDESVLALLREIRDEETGARDDMARAWSTLRVAAEKASAQALQDEYQEVFIGVGGGEITPYASWYVAGSLLERPLVLLRQDLAELGVERQEGVSEPEDHAGAICEAMALVINDPDVDFEWQREFFQRHLAPWLGRFFEELQQAPSAGFYRAVGCIGEQFFKLEQRYFAMLG